MKLIALIAAAGLITGCATDVRKYYEAQTKAI